MTYSIVSFGPLSPVCSESVSNRTSSQPQASPSTPRPASAPSPHRLLLHGDMEGWVSSCSPQKPMPSVAVLAALQKLDGNPEIRQVGIVDAQGRAEAFTGARCA